MLEKIKEEISKTRENLDILPHTKKSDQKKYLEYIDNTIENYQKIQNDVKAEIIKRKNKYLEIRENPKIEELSQINLDYDKLLCLNEYATSFEKMNLDVNLFKLRYYYKDNLAAVNETIISILSSFKEVNIILSIKDFNYTSYVQNYMKIIFSKKHDEKTLYQEFEKIYWECPDIINLIRLNFYHLYYKNQKKIDQYFAKKYKNQNLNNYLNDVQKSKKELNQLLHNDQRYFINGFLNNNFLLNDYSETNINKLLNKYLNDQTSTQNYLNLIKLSLNLKEYKLFLEYKPLIDKISELYKDKNSYQNLYQNKLKEIFKNEKNLFSLNKKTSKTGLFKPNQNKIRELILKIDNTLEVLKNLYDELENLTIKEKIFKYIKDDTDLKSTLEIASLDLKFLYEHYKEEYTNLSIDELIDLVNKLKTYLYTNNLNIISNVKITDNENISQIIKDHYALLNINLTDEELTEGLDSLIKNINILINNFDFQNIKLDMDVVDFLVQIEKNNIE